jgi:hypothetical protein
LHAVLTAAIVLAIDVVSASGPPQPARVTAVEVKAAYLLNFGRFTTWPSAADTADSDPFSLCLIGADPFGVALETTVAGETIDGRPVAIRRIAAPSDAAACRIVFVGALKAAELTRLLRQLDGAPTLTVSDAPQFLEHGGMIQFVLDGSRVRFAVDLSATSRAGLMLSSSLLRVAASVRREKAGA